MSPLSLRIAALVVCLGSESLSDDFKTINGTEYKNVQVSGVEPDGIMLKTKSGLTKVYFTELPKEVQQRFHYDAQQGAQYSAQTFDQVTTANQQKFEQDQKRADEIARNLATVHAREYDRQDGTHVKEYVRSAPGYADTVVAVASSPPRDKYTISKAATSATSKNTTQTHYSDIPYANSVTSGVQRDGHGRIKRSESAKR